MAHTESFSVRTYFDSLRQDVQFGISVLYSLFRGNAKYLVELGLNEHEAAHCFRLAISDVTRLARSEEKPDEYSMEELLRQLSLSHALLLHPYLRVELPEHPLLVKADILQTQQKAAVWSALENLDADCQEVLLTQPTLVEGPCAEALREKLQGVSSEMVQTALLDVEGFRSWKYAGANEQIYQKSTTKIQSAEGNGRSVWRWAMFIFLGVVCAYAAYQFLFRPKTLAELYAQNFVPPRSLLADWQQRHRANSDSTTPPLTENCWMLLRESDAAYQAGNLHGAMDPLLLIVLDTMAACRSDAWLYLGIIHLRLEDPIAAMQCFAKIEDFEHFGEDIYWYQVMAYLQIAQNNPQQRERVAKAVELAIPNLHTPERRARAEALLKNLSP
ncbi:MAG: hypothetical protein NZM43_08675 [Saprospiraceae bacterium]|nr:hypothetical protein [Saprospiraceae bacterium]MDW8484385.1 hypothetical protein [Saprospiraceae bacterium]